MSPLATAYDEFELDLADPTPSRNAPRSQTSRARFERSARYERGKGGKAKQFNGAHLKRGRRPNGL